MKFMLHVAGTYPSRTLFTLLALLTAGVVQALSLTTLLPAIGLAMDQENAQQAGMVAEILRNSGIELSLGALLSILVIGISVKSLLVLFAKRRVGYTVAQIATDLRGELLRAVMNARWDYFVGRPAGTLTDVMGSQPAQASAAYLNGTRTVSLLIEAVVYAAVALSVSWEAAVMALAVGVLIMGGFGRLIRWSRHIGKQQTEVMSNLSGRMADTLQSAKALKAMGITDRAGAVLESQTARLNKVLRREVFSSEALGALYEPVIVAFVAVGLYLAVGILDLPLANVLVLMLLLVKVLSSLGKVQRSYQKMVTGESAYWSMLRTIESAVQAKEPSPKGQRLWLERELEFDSVSFGFGDKPVLRNLNLKLPAGSFTTLIGPSGVGKSTVLDIITGLIQPEQGEVRVDGTPLPSGDLLHWRRQIGYVPQETLLLHDTVLHNVTLGDPALDEVDAEQALRDAGAWELVAAMPQGLYTLLGERGGRLSGGQRQRLCIARALVRRPRLLILDEPTSALDPESESAVCDTLAGLRGRMTILAVSHQTELTAISERVLRLADGAVLVAAELRLPRVCQPTPTSDPGRSAA